MPPTAADLQPILDEAAAVPGVPHVVACVHAPSRGLHAWCGAAGRPPPDPRAPFRIASVTKMFTAAAVLRLAEDGRLGLHDPLSRHGDPGLLQALCAGGYDVDAITLSHLLTHCSGLPDHPAQQDAQGGYTGAVAAGPQRRWTRAGQLAIALRMGPPLGAPGEACHYSDTGYVLLGDVIERATGQALGPAVRALLGPGPGLPHTHWELQEPEPAGSLPRLPQQLGDVDTRHFDPSFDLYGGGGIVSTVADLAVFTRALLRGETFRSPATLAAALAVPEARRAAGSRIHARVVHAYPVTPTAWGWGHLGFWGCGAIAWPEQDVTVALSFDVAPMPDPMLLRHTVQRLMQAAAAAG